MGSRWGDRDEVSEVDVVELIRRFLPPGEACATTTNDEFVVTWAAAASPARVFIGRSRESFEDAYHALIAKTATFYLSKARSRSSPTSSSG
jgi:hypothetical protein